MAAAARVNDLDRSVQRIREHRVLRHSKWKIGSELSLVHREKLWRLRSNPDGTVAYNSFAHFCESELGMTKSYALELIDISRAFDEREVRQYGASKLIYILRAPMQARSLMRSKIEEGASQREIKRVLRAIKAECGAVDMKRVTGRKVVGSVDVEHVEQSVASPDPASSAVEAAKKDPAVPEKKRRMLLVVLDALIRAVVECVPAIELPVGDRKLQIALSLKRDEA